MFKLFKKNKSEEIVAPATGQLIKIESVSDDVFSQKMMGDGFAVDPVHNDIVSPVAGVVSTVFPTKHAIGITTEKGLEVLVHMGLDTVELNGEPFDMLVESGNHVEPNTPLAIMDIDKVKAGGKGTTIVIVYTNMDKIDSVPIVSPQYVDHGDAVGTLTYQKG
ncbi:PTS glucose transporter subunit IIABC [Lactobacillus sp. CBA3606]|uniref:PTS sugar transporter subunit IIA n=1 Tax=Lactobacillus sp. CBA3606 TaxID=2099789 RepID=UPI000CFB610A|nr:PTS glucose transporter subunit IIA [Lactobacillus sp. CBA3606]AVK64050.1 PTS glucose transporter subunit IIABC [Lactobacillus sp. CBA3606]